MKFDIYYQAKCELKTIICEIGSYYKEISSALNLNQVKGLLANSTSMCYFDRARAVPSITQNRKLLDLAEAILKKESRYRRAKMVLDTKKMQAK